MTIKNAEEFKFEKSRIDLRGPEGNAYVLLGYAYSTYRELRKKDLHPETSLDDILYEMKSGDYDNLVETFDKYFGEYFDLYK